MKFDIRALDDADTVIDVRRLEAGVSFVWVRFHESGHYIGEMTLSVPFAVRLASKIYDVTRADVVATAEYVPDVTPITDDAPVSTPTTITTQAELDAAPKQTWHDLGPDTFNVKADQWVHAHESSTVYAHEGSIVRAHEGSRVAAYEGSRVAAYEGSRVHAHESSTVYAHEGSTVYAYEGSYVYAHEGSIVRAYEGSYVYARKGSIVRAHEGSIVAAGPGSTVYDRVEGEWVKR